MLDVLDKIKRTFAKRLLRLVAVITFCTVTTSASAQHNQHWQKYEFEGHPFKDTDNAASWYSPFLLKGEQELKFNSCRLYNEETLLLFGYDVTSWFTTCVGHRIVRARNNGQGHLLTEQRPTFELCFKLPEFKTLRIDLRSRFEWRDKAHTQPYLRYRERLRVRTSWSVTDFKFSPYFHEEMNFSDKPSQDDADLFDRSRAQFGISFKPVPSHAALTCNLFYMVQHDRIGHTAQWNPINVFGLHLHYRF